MITDIEDFFTKGCGRCARFDTDDCATRFWPRGLKDLRRICLGQGLSEAVKWAHPCYIHAGRNIAIIGAFRQDFRLTFFNAALMQDPAGVLERQGPNTKHPDMIRFTDEDQVRQRETLIRAYLDEAMGYAAKGVKPPKDTTEPDLPVELADALDTDPALAEAFDGLTPGRRKSYILNLNAAKQPETRVRRIARFRGKILAGKGALER
ncbi:YdeI/OmpD-associated family protein [Rhodobacteraceae bacterium NNCM2]|nr:YdeI/OmpD-associated family protein [Coraliihabitans acroporae]